MTSEKWLLYAHALTGDEINENCSSYLYEEHIRIVDVDTGNFFDKFAFPLSFYKFKTRQMLHIKVYFLKMNFCIFLN